MPGIDKECEGAGATHHKACKCREEYVAHLELDNHRLRQALRDCYEGWLAGNDVIGPMRKAAAVLKGRQ